MEEYYNLAARGSTCRSCARPSAMPQTYLLDSLEPDLEVGYSPGTPGTGDVPTFPAPINYPPVSTAPHVGASLIGVVVLGGILWWAASR